MANRDIVVVGGSAGALQALNGLLAALPADLPAALFVVVHGGSATPDSLARMLGGAGPLQAESAEDGARFHRGRIYAAPKDVHMLIRDGRIALRRGPRENMARPAIDPFFRTAASAYGSRVVGVLLSGLLYDGAAGMRAVARCGGINIVQHPDDALYLEMPRNALEHAEVAHCEPAARLGQILVRLVSEPAGPPQRIPEEIAREASLNLHAAVPEDAETPVGQLSPLTCPDCGGSLSELRDGALLRFRCHTGHAYDARQLLGTQVETVERALWSAVRAHEERATLLRRLADQARANNALAAARRWEEHLAEREEEANVIRRLLLYRRAAETEAETASERPGSERLQNEPPRNEPQRDEHPGDERPDGLDQALG